MTTETKGMIGAELGAGRYHVRSQLGAGGMAFVYLALDRKENREVVVKVPRQAMLDDPDFSGRFLREVKSLVRLSHPNIAKILDVGDHEGKPYLVLEYFSGGSLRDRLAKGPQSVEVLQRWLSGIAAALDFCHQNECVHRDVKPDNILFDAHGKAHLSDFGIAKVMSQSPKTRMTVLTGTGIVLGTAQYMAPELVMGKKYDGKADQYGLAVTVYECLAGQTPFIGNTPMAVIVEQSTKDVPPLHKVASGVSRKLSEIVGRGLAKDPSGRYKQCLDFANAVAAIDGTADTGEQAQAAVETAKTILCPNCRKPISLPTGRTAGRTQCPHCQAGLVVTDKKKAPESGKNKRPNSATKKSLAPATARQNKSDSQTVAMKLRGSTRKIVLLGAIVGVLVAILAALPLGWLLVKSRFVPNSTEELPLIVDSAPLPNKAPQPFKIEFAPTATVMLKMGQTNSVPIKVKRGDYGGPITIWFESLPAKVEATKPIVIEEGQNEASLEIRVLADAPELVGKGKLLAKGPGLEAREEVVNIRVVTPLLRIFFPSSEFSIIPGEARDLTVNVERDGYRGPIVFEATGLPLGVSLRSETIVGGKGETIDARLQLLANANVLSTVTQPKIVARFSNNKSVEREFTLTIKTPPLTATQAPKEDDDTKPFALDIKKAELKQEWGSLVLSKKQVLKVYAIHEEYKPQLANLQNKLRDLDEQRNVELKKGANRKEMIATDADFARKMDPVRNQISNLQDREKADLVKVLNAMQQDQLRQLLPSEFASTMGWQTIEGKVQDVRSLSAVERKKFPTISLIIGLWDPSGRFIVQYEIEDNTSHFGTNGKKDATAKNSIKAGSVVRLVVAQEGVKTVVKEVYLLSNPDKIAYSGTILRVENILKEFDEKGTFIYSGTLVVRTMAGDKKFTVGPHNSVIDSSTGAKFSRASYESFIKGGMTGRPVTVTVRIDEMREILVDVTIGGKKKG